MEKSKKYLYLILLSIKRIENFRVDMIYFSIYQINLKTQIAVERKRVIIREILNKLRKTEPDLKMRMQNKL
jgi:uncharacterized protein with HEPN domain